MGITENLKIHNPRVLKSSDLYCFIFFIKHEHLLMQSLVL